MSQARTGTFVHVVATVDIANGSGKILYVNPSSVTTAPEPTAADAAGLAAPGASPLGKFELSIQNAQGAELRRLRPAIQISGCEPGQQPKTGLISEDIPLFPGMQRLVLLYDGDEVSRFVAGEQSPLMPGAAASGMHLLSLDALSESKPHHKSMSAAGNVAPEAGITYTVQVRPEGDTIWQTIAVGRPTPRIDMDRNQFPGATSVRVRVLRSTGFQDEVFAEEDVDLNY